MPASRCHELTRYCRVCGAYCPVRRHERPCRRTGRVYCSAACRDRAMREHPLRLGRRAEPRRPSESAAFRLAVERARLAALLHTLPEAEAQLVRLWHGLS